MSDLTRAVLLSWDIRAEIVVTLLALALIYGWGWLRLRRRGAVSFARGWRLASYWTGILILGIALMSPIDVMGSQLFLMHMVQHLLFMMVAAPLMLLANPFPVMLWALPRDLRLQVGAWFQPEGIIHRLLSPVMKPGLIWMFYVALYLGWHDPNLYSAALRTGWLHDVQHLSFFAASQLFWWFVFGAGPRIGRRPPPMVRAMFALSMIPPNMIAGVAITMAETPIYPYYTEIPRIFSMSIMEDQIWAGLIMWVPGSMMYIVAAILLVGVQMGGQASRIAARERREREISAPSSLRAGQASG